MKDKIVQAIKNNEIKVAMQKIRNVATEEETKCELLARLNIEGKDISPCDFIETAKDHDIYHLITRTMIEKSFSFMKINTSIEEFSININMSDINNEKTIEFLINKIQTDKIGDRLVLELTEDEELTKDIVYTKSIMNQLKELGCKFALDDFGKGYATFNPLLNFDFDYIKLDEVLCKNFLNDERKFYIVNLLSEYSKRLKIFIIAEYIESKEEYDALKYMDIAYIQGYYVHKPEIINDLL